MPSKRKQHKPTIKPKKASVEFLGWFRRRSIAEVIVGVVIVLLAGYFAKHQIDIYQEKQMYNAAEREISSFAEKAAKMAPSTTDKYKGCSRNSAKFEKGFLGCRVGENITYTRVASEDAINLINDLNTLQSQLKWEFDFDNTKSNQASYPNILSVKVYKYKNLTCSVKFEYKSDDIRGYNFDKTALVVVASCGGSALKEYY